MPRKGREGRVGRDGGETGTGMGERKGQRWVWRAGEGEERKGGGRGKGWE